MHKNQIISQLIKEKIITISPNKPFTYASPGVGPLRGPRPHPAVQLLQGARHHHGPGRGGTVHAPAGVPGPGGVFLGDEPAQPHRQVEGSILPQNIPFTATKNPLRNQGGERPTPFSPLVLSVFAAREVLSICFPYRAVPRKFQPWGGGRGGGCPGCGLPCPGRRWGFPMQPGWERGRHGHAEEAYSARAATYSSRQRPLSRIWAAVSLPTYR